MQEVIWTAKWLNQYEPEQSHFLIRKSKRTTGVKGGGVKITRPKIATSICKESIPQQAVDLLMLGHSDPGFTLRTYTHVTNPMQVKAAETVGNVIGSKLE